MIDDLRERVAQIIENLRHDSSVSSVEMANAALAEIGAGRECLLGEDCDMTIAYLAGRGSVEAKGLANRVAIMKLEARVATADKLVEALSFYADATVEYPNGTVTFQPGDDNGQRAKVALAAYQATKEQDQ